MVPGCAGAAVLTVEVVVRAALVPQVLDAVTLMVPLTVPAVAVMLLLPCPEVIAQPASVMSHA
jgi:hypothetical protein